MGDGDAVFSVGVPEVVFVCEDVVVKDGLGVAVTLDVLVGERVPEVVPLGVAETLGLCVKLGVAVCVDVGLQVIFCAVS